MSAAENVIIIKVLFWHSTTRSISQRHCSRLAAICDSPFPQSCKQPLTNSLCLLVREGGCYCRAIFKCIAKIDPQIEKKKEPFSSNHWEWGKEHNSQRHKEQKKTDNSTRGERRAAPFLHKFECMSECMHTNPDFCLESWRVKWKKKTTTFLICQYFQICHQL